MDPALIVNLPWNVKSVSGGGCDELDDGLHASGALEEGEELLGLFAGDVGDPPGRRRLLVVEALGRLHGLLLRQGQGVVHRRPLVGVLTVDHHGGQSPRHLSTNKDNLS